MYRIFFSIPSAFSQVHFPTVYILIGVPVRQVLVSLELSLTLEQKYFRGYLLFVIFFSLSSKHTVLCPYNDHTEWKDK